MIGRNFPYFLVSFAAAVTVAFFVFQFFFSGGQNTFLLNPVIASSQMTEIKKMATISGTMANLAAPVSSGPASPSASYLTPEIAASETAKVVLGTASAEIATPGAVVSRPVVPDPPKITIPPHSPQEIDSFFQKYASQYNVSVSELRKIAVCESGYNANSRNGIYGGMFQFVASTWASTRMAMGENPDPDLRFSPEEAIKTAAFKISRDGLGAWKNCSV